MNVLIVYGTTEGMTARIAQRMGEVADSLGWNATVSKVEDAERELPPGPFDAVLVGGSVHIGQYQRAVRRFVLSHLEMLAETRSAFFSVGMAIASKNEADRRAARRLAAEFPAKLGWRPNAIEVFAGALMFSRYGFLTRLVMRAIARREQGSVDTRADHVYTDWNSVERFVKGFLAPRAPEVRPPPPIGEAPSAPL